MTNEKQESEEEKEKRKGDITLWEKRFSIYLLTLMVGIATGQIVEMNTSVKLIKSDLAYNRDLDAEQDTEIKDLKVVQQEIKSTQKQNCYRLDNVEGRLSKIKL